MLSGQESLLKQDCAACERGHSAKCFARGEALLTPREDQVVNLVAEGIGNRDIAQQLGIKENTVKKSLMRIYDKVGVSNRVELVL